MESKRPARCNENEGAALYIWKKRQEMAERGGISDNLDMTLSNAYRNICNSKTPIKTLKDLSQIKGVGKWIVRLMQGFFPNDAPGGAPPRKGFSRTGSKAKGPKRYVPQKNSVAYALLITLYRGIQDEVGFMKKSELIDAAEASGLSRTSIRPDKVKGKPGQGASSGRDWYTGWSCMKTLISKGLVAKSSCPAKYMLTQEGKEVARECLLRSGLTDATASLLSVNQSHCSTDKQNVGVIANVSIDAEDATIMAAADLTIQKGVDTTSIDLFVKNSQCDSLESSDSGFVCVNDCPSASISCTSSNTENGQEFSHPHSSKISNSVPMTVIPASFNPRGCTSLVGALEGDTNALAMPPCMLGEKFEEIYDIILILDYRENFGSRSRKVIDCIRSQFSILVEVRRLPIGDGIWIVRHKQSNSEYVLDFIVERKEIDDLGSSILDNRYRDQKLRLQRCGLRKVIYLVEGDPNALEAAESIKTACFTTEILEGFDVQRTSGFADTVRRYGFLSLSIMDYYRTHFCTENVINRKICPTFNEFLRRCHELEKLTVSNVFSLQLMQVPLVTEDIALIVVDLYPTLLSLAHAYSLLEEDARAQEEMLKNQNRMITNGASKNIFKLVWESF
ncbi:Crossover junction endonuclease MUS81 [Apostasia shenzhenica]|uniref:Crossover junction endonuclease MUS81 n=1 Tax=Apostasia shenzhenica TaxID=1088818 RepID=A0A2I0BGR6_9ASPA|nr:Crossover junction endonuclease MUS81 [Apostasia shenzhenica]